MLQKTRDKLTIGILQKLRTQGAPAGTNAGLMGPHDEDEEDVPVNSDGTIVESPSDVLGQRKKKRKSADDEREDETTD